MNVVVVRCPVCECERPRTLRKGPIFSFLGCPECGAEFVDPLQPTVAPQVLFDRYPWTQQFSANYEAYLPMAQRSLEEKLRISESLSGIRPRSMLDVGCGNGIYLHAGQLLGLRVLGTEVDGHSAAIARGRGLAVQSGRLEDLDITLRYDFVHIRMIVYMCPRPVELLRSAVARLAPNGVVYVDTSHQAGLFSAVRRRFQSDPLRHGNLVAPTHCVSYTRRAFETLLERAGLTPRQTFTYSARSPIYYPLISRSARSRAEGLLKAAVDRVGMGAFLAAYCVSSGVNR